MTHQKIDPDKTIISLIGQLESANFRTQTEDTLESNPLWNTLVNQINDLEDLTLPSLIAKAHGTARRKGWWEKNPDIPTLLLLVHSEISEAVEAIREKPELKYYLEPNGKPAGFMSEIADVLIRIFDMCGGYQLNLVDSLLTKMAYNEKREYRHGGKLF